PTNDAFIRIASEAGYVITLEDLTLITAGEEVSDAELETFAGGGEFSQECRPMYPKTWNYCDW
ncbi:MAG: Nif11-like leader peptide family RiPP precursor, partial [Candidatus Nanopelagicales bacterium]